MHLHTHSLSTGAASPLESATQLGEWKGGWFILLTFHQSCAASSTVGRWMDVSCNLREPQRPRGFNHLGLSTGVLFKYV